MQASHASRRVFSVFPQSCSLFSASLQDLLFECSRVIEYAVYCVTKLIKIQKEGTAKELSET